uniref:Ig-like domain-containing protein n=1 Tax=Pelusios castaneus TaxID=367368 RepID=A0A8C8S995_9SAUR
GKPFPAQFAVVGPEHPIPASLRGEAILSCHLFPRMSAENMEVRWIRSQLSTVVHLYKNGKDQDGEQGLEYRGRTELLKDDIANGRVSLRIRDIRPSDDGQYTCVFQSGVSYEEALLELQVAGLGSDPALSMEDGRSGSEIRVVCRSSGWYPKPDVEWRNLQGQLLPSDSKTISEDANGLFQTKTSIFITKGSTQNMFCRVRNPRLNQDRVSPIHIPEKLQDEITQFTVTGPDHPIPASVGGEAVLPCHLSPRMSAEKMEVRWFRSRFSTVVHVYLDGQDQDGDQIPEYRGRTKFLKDDIANGSVSLRIRNIRPSDDGQYKCFFESDGLYEEALLELQVAALGSSPAISLEEHQDGGIRVACRSSGWYPEPKMLWRDLQGEVLPSASEKISPEADGLFQTESTVVIRAESNQKVTCRVMNPRLNQERESEISIAGQCPPKLHRDRLRWCRHGCRVF